MNKDKAFGKLITTEGIIKDLEFSKKMVTLKEMQDCVKGYIEFIYLPNNMIMVVNEEGKIDGLEINTPATTFLQSNDLPHIIVGDALIIENKFVN